MNHFRKLRVIESPEDAATYRQWRRAVCIFYAVVCLFLVAAWGSLQFVKHGDEAQFASSPRLLPAVEVGRGERGP
jgi:hypothetical protein